MKIGKEISSLYYEDGAVKKVLTGICTLRNYRRIFLNQALPVLGLFANRQTEILLYLLGNADSNNMIYCTYQHIMEGCKINDKKAIGKVLKTLQEAEVIVQVSQSHYMLNPAVIMQGDNRKFGLLASTFNEILHKNKRKKESK